MKTIDIKEGLYKKIKAESASNTLKTDKEIYLFISFDLVDSTVFKTKIENKSIWQYVIFYFYDTFNIAKTTILKKMFVWKYIGDEIILCAKIDSIDELQDIPKKAFELQNKISKEIQERFKIKLDIKGALWLAPVVYYDRGQIEEFNKNAKSKGSNRIKNNIYKNIKIILNNGLVPTYDFLGPDIDTGFRIAKYAYKNKIILSAEYAYLLLKQLDEAEKKKIKIVSFEHLKGVWDDRAYPIIWYYNDWSNINDDFEYDEYKKNNIIRDIKNRKDLSYLETVFKQLTKLDEIKKFLEECKTIKSCQKNNNKEA